MLKVKIAKILIELFIILAKKSVITFDIIAKAGMCNQQLTGFLYICISQQGKTTKVPCILCSSSPINITEINLNIYMQAF